MVAGRELDALVAQEIFGLNVIEERLTIVHVEGDASVHVDSDPDGWACYAETGPVYKDTHGHEWPRPEMGEFYEGRADRLKRDQAEWDTDMKRFGCPHHLLYAVNWYSTDIAAAWEVVEKLKADGFSLMAEWDDHDGMWYFGFSNASSYKAGEADTAPHAICLAALKAVGALPPAQEDE